MKNTSTILDKDDINMITRALIESYNDNISDSALTDFFISISKTSSHILINTYDECECSDECECLNQNYMMHENEGLTDESE